jgi:hypothetical protein
MLFMNMSNPQMQLEPRDFGKLSIIQVNYLFKPYNLKGLFDHHLEDIYWRNLIIFPFRTETMILVEMS